MSIPPHMRPMSPGEINDLLSSALHGPLPHATVQRMMATLATVPEMAAEVERLTAANETMWASRTSKEEPGLRPLASRLARLLRDLECPWCGNGVCSKGGMPEAENLLLAAERAGLMPDNPTPPPRPEAA